MNKSELESVAEVIGRMRYVSMDIDPRDIVQQASLMVLESGRPLCAQTVYGFARHVMYHELDKRRIRLRYSTERISWMPAPDYGYETPGRKTGFGTMRPEEREITERLLDRAERRNSGLVRLAAKGVPKFVREYLEASRKNADGKRSVARKTSTNNNKDRQ